jgi:hypothetical protein
MNRPSVIRSTLQDFLRQEKFLLSGSPILLVASSATAPATRAQQDSTISTTIHQFQFYAKQQFGLPLVTTEIPSAFCSDKDIPLAQKIQKRIGASTIIGIGSGAAIDLAKCLAAESQSSNLYLLPSTSAALWASYTPFSLVFDSTEETIVTNEHKLHQMNESYKHTIIIQPQVAFHPHTLMACQSILLDAAQYDPSLLGLELSNLNLEEIVEYAAKCVSTGKDSINLQPRSIPLCLAMALIPPVFSSTNILSFYASLLPGIRATLDMAGTSTLFPGETFFATSSNEPPKLASMALDALSVESLLQFVRDNQVVTKALDVDQDILAKVLAVSLNQ